jgi:hypothetical protein
MSFEKYLEKNYPKPKNGYNHNVYNNFKKLYEYQQSKIDLAVKALEEIDKQLSSEEGSPIKIGIITLKALVAIETME